MWSKVFFSELYSSTYFLYPFDNYETCPLSASNLAIRIRYFCLSYLVNSCLCSLSFFFNKYYSIYFSCSLNNYIYYFCLGFQFLSFLCVYDCSFSLWKGIFAYVFNIFLFPLIISQPFSKAMTPTNFTCTVNSVSEIT